MPLTITEKMAKKDPFFDLGFKKGLQIRRYKKLLNWKG